MPEKLGVVSAQLDRLKTRQRGRALVPGLQLLWAAAAVLVPRCQPLNGPRVRPAGRELGSGYTPRPNLGTSPLCPQGGLGHSQGQGPVHRLVAGAVMVGSSAPRAARAVQQLILGDMGCDWRAPPLSVSVLGCRPAFSGHVKGSSFPWDIWKGEAAPGPGPVTIWSARILTADFPPALPLACS